MHVEQVDFINVPTRDTKRAFAWYREVLGLPTIAGLLADSAAERIRERIKAAKPELEVVK